MPNTHVPRSVGSLLIVAVVAIACSSGGTAVRQVQERSAGPSTSLVPPTPTPTLRRPTARPQTLTPRPAATRSAAPEPSPTALVIDLPEPILPSFITDAIAGWEDAEIRSLCVTVTVMGELETTSERGTPAAFVERTADSLIAPVESEGCDARLAVAIDLEPTSAQYESLGQCWNGLQGMVVATLSMDGRRTATATDDAYHAPPWGLLEGQCRPTAVVGGDTWSIHVDRALSALLGWPYWLAFQASADVDTIDFDYRDSMGADLVNDVVVDLVNARLSDSHPDVRFGAAWFVGLLADDGTERTRTLLEPVIPYLIRALAREGDGPCTWDGRRDDFDARPLRCTLARALRAITGETLEARGAAWWQWWRQRTP